MKGYAKLLHEFIEGNKIQFLIPVYQRNYDWQIENCEQLFGDLVKLSSSNRSTHFFGSIVTSSADSSYNRLVIDGQQRLTTISLLLLAGIRAVRDGVLEITDESRMEEAYETFLNAKFSNSERKIKLLPIENDRIAYDRIFRGEDGLVENSKVTRNYRYFYEKLTRKPQTLSFDQMLDAVEQLQIISIELEKDDDAQLIFESLNSTGLALTEADKIRNYILMSLTPEEQQVCFNDYWQKIEYKTENQPTRFLRDYLTIKRQLQRPVREANIYSEWKKYMEGRERKTELVEMLEYAGYYQQITEAKLSTPKLSEKMRHICNIETDVANVFFIQFLKYVSTHALPDEEVYKVIDLVENYLARRIVCNMPGNALTQVFCALHKDVLKSMDEYASANVELKNSYSEILAYHIMRRDGNYQLPRDVQFEESIKIRDAYHMPKPFQIFLFERLENAIPGEYNDVATEMKNKDATIEHIMPQTLTKEWKAMLGDNFQEIQEKYLHTFANLTLTGFNSKLSNKPFGTKRDGNTIGNEICPGYGDSKYRLTRSVTSCDKWTEIELQNRCKEMVDIFLRLYPLPAMAFKPLPKPIDEVSLDEETFSPTNRKLKGFRLFGEEYEENTWKNMLLQVVKTVEQKYTDIVDTLYDKEAFFYSAQKVLAKEVNARDCTEIAPQKYLLTSLDNTSKLRCMRSLFDKCDIAESELVMLLEPIKE